jgi:hypothetical protein
MSVKLGPLVLRILPTTPATANVNDENNVAREPNRRVGKTKRLAETGLAKEFAAQYTPSKKQPSKPDDVVLELMRRKAGLVQINASCSKEKRHLLDDLYEDLDDTIQIKRDGKPWPWSTPIPIHVRKYNTPNSRLLSYELISD